MIDPKVTKMHKTENGSLKAFVEVTFNDCLSIKGFKVMEGRNGLFVSMPSERGKDDRWYESVRILDDSTSERVKSMILHQYQHAEV